MEKKYFLIEGIGGGVWDPLYKHKKYSIKIATSNGSLMLYVLRSLLWLAAIL